ncbi:MAG: PEP-CTERM sorting domain-containing protein [Verrucomicrobiales bacterium]
MALVAAQANAATLANPGLPYTYSFPAGTTIAGPGGAAETASPHILKDGFYTTQADIDADAGVVGGYYINGGNPPGFIFGTGAGNNRSIQFDLGSTRILGPVDMYYSVHGPFAVDAPWQVDVTIDGGAPISFNPFDISVTVNTAGPRGDARMATIDLTGRSGQFIELDFYSDGRTNLAGGGSQSGVFGGEWTGMNEIVFIPEPATMTLALMGLGGLVLRRRRRHSFHDCHE